MSGSFSPSGGDAGQGSKQAAAAQFVVELGGQTLDKLTAHIGAS